MDKVGHSNSQSLPIWERQKSSKGHRSAVDRALEAHRQRKSEREVRVQERLNIVRGLQNQFFPTARIEEQPMLQDEQIKMQPIQETPLSMPDNFNPRQIENIYDEAQLGSVGDNALAVVGKEVANPEQEPVEDVPKGSYINYRV